MHNILPDKYRNLNDTELQIRIAYVKKQMGKDLCILGHYYQRDEIIQFADHEGDSFTLAKAGASTSSKWIVFCGVHFMAEASVILAKPNQRVFLPDMDAGCPMADMAAIDDVEDAWRELKKKGVSKDFIPITYMNSNAALKAFCGRLGGLVCTSSSAKRAFEWALKQNKKIFFFPDENLGRNTAHSLGVRSDEIMLWKGYCHVHTFFTVEHIKEARTKYPDCKIIVHPECSPEVVSLSDGNGSTAFLKKYAEDASAGSTIVIGTEINLVSRLAKQLKDKKIVPLARSLCPNMFKISLADLCFTLEELGKVNEVFVADDIARDAKVALDRMLAL